MAKVIEKRQKIKKDLRMAYESLPANKITQVRDRIVEQCGVHVTTFYNWLDNPDSCPKLSRVVVCSNMGINEFEYFTPIS